MRNFEERRAEIFRRSEERINARKQARKRVLLCTVPVLVCAVIWSAVALPGTLTERGGSNTLAESGAPRYILAEVKSRNDGIGYDKTFAEQSAVSDIAALIQAFYDAPRELPSASADTSSRKESGQNQPLGIGGSDGTLPPKGEGIQQPQTEGVGDLSQYSRPIAVDRIDCTITLTASDGSQKVYIFTGDRLLGEKQSETLLLTEAETAALAEALGLSEYPETKGAN